jgi:amino acid transporter
MEIEEMQALWSEMSDQLEHQKKLTDKIIMDMTQERYSNKFRKITTIETIGALVCFIMGIYILVNFYKLDTWYLMACGAITLIFLFALPILVLRALRNIRNVNIRDKNYKETLLDYSKAKKRLMNLQKAAIFASFIIMIAASGVFAKIWSNKDFFMAERNIWANLAIVVAILFVSFFSYWGYRSYGRLTNAAENVLKELE